MRRRALLSVFGGLTLDWSTAGLPTIGLSTVAACNKDKASADKGAKNSLPPLKLRDDTEGVVLSWIDAKGQVHTAFKPPEVPEKARGLVRVVTEKGGQGEQLYVADLRHKQADGSYLVSSMSRANWEQEIESRRKAHRAKEPKKAPGNPGAGTGNHVTAIVYGAEWCQPCHQAAAFLKSKGVAVMEYDIEREPARAAEMQQKLRRSGRRGGSIPVIDLGGQVFVGFNRRRLSQAITQLRFRQERR